MENVTSGLTEEKQSTVAVMGKYIYLYDMNFHPQRKNMLTVRLKVKCKFRHPGILNSSKSMSASLVPKPSLNAILYQEIDSLQAVQNVINDRHSHD